MVPARWGQDHAEIVKEKRTTDLPPSDSKSFILLPGGAQLCVHSLRVNLPQALSARCFVRAAFLMPPFNSTTHDFEKKKRRKPNQNNG
jgi:hypothetical protein